MKKVTITELVRDNTAYFQYFRDGKMIYDIVDHSGKKVARFDIDVSDMNEVGNASFEHTHKAITLMRYIRKALKDETIFVY